MAAESPPPRAHRYTPSRVERSPSGVTIYPLYNLDQPRFAQIHDLNDVFGDRAVVKRCQVHKARNVRDHVPEERQAYVRQQMRAAYQSKSAKTARATLGQLGAWLESRGEDAAAASLREGLDETLTVLRLGLPATLGRTFATTNAIGNMNGTLRRVIRSVKRWRGESMLSAGSGWESSRRSAASVE